MTNTWIVTRFGLLEATEGPALGLIGIGSRGFGGIWLPAGNGNSETVTVTVPTDTLNPRSSGEPTNE